MESWMLGLAIGLTLSALVAVFLRLEACHRSLLRVLKESRNELVGAIDKKSTVDVAQNAIDLIRDEIQASIADVAGNMRVPTAVDHLAGVFANVMQMREQWKIQKEAQELNGAPLISPTEPSE
jgi:hypothetical protein